jgi:ATP/maltotriose-dependent transcriptional regulator MalT
VKRTRAYQPSRWITTPQEREIALMAAAGMSNKQIGERLFLSHRTVGTHLRAQNPRWARTAGVSASPTASTSSVTS